MNKPDLKGLKTPSLLLDIERVRRNAKRMRRKAETFGVRLRPHIKTHKCVEVAQIATEGGEKAVTVSTLAEARAFAAGGFDDITYAVPIVPGKFEEVLSMMADGVGLNLLTDDADVAAELDRAASVKGLKPSVFLKVDCGYHRCGVEPHTNEASEIPRQIDEARNLRFAGILTHAGHSYHARSKEEILEIARGERDSMAEFAEKLRADGIEVPVVSIGSTPTISLVDHLDGVDEVRPGNYIFFDAFQATLGSCGFEDCALTVLATVIHRSFDHKKVIVDAGAIALSKDRGAIDLDEGCGYGRVLDPEGEDTGLRVGTLSQEHGEIVVEDDGLLDELKVGTRLRILANHSCLTAAQFDSYNVLEDAAVVDRWKTYRGW